jgi:hypothetical protein
LIVLAQPAAPFSAETEVPELAQLDFPVHVLPLRDFLLLIERFDTAGDLVPYLELRHDMRAALDRRVHTEAVALRQISDRIGEFMKVVRPGIAPELLQRTVRYFRLAAFEGWGRRVPVLSRDRRYYRASS